MFTSIENAEKEIRANAESCAKYAAHYWQEQVGERIEQMERTFQAVSLLRGAGVSLPVEYEESQGRGVTYNLGKLNKTRRDRRKLADILRDIRQALQCKLSYHGHSEESAENQTVRLTMVPVDYPEIKVVWIEKMKTTKSSPARKCRWVTRKVRTLECST